MASEEPTTLDLVERWQQEIEALNRRDVDAVMRFYTADALYDNGPVGLDAHLGHAQIRGFVEDWLSSYAGSLVPGSSASASRNHSGIVHSRCTLVTRHARG